MSDVALLNAPREASVCNEMLAEAKALLATAEHSLTHNVLEREAYLLTMGQVVALRNVIRSLDTIYGRNFRT